jgi:isocitrate dehydrogenase (NAD+)
MTYMPSPGDAKPHTVTLIPGDGIGPEMTSAVIAVVEALKAPIVWERFDTLSGSTEDGKPPSAVPKDVLDSIRRNKVALKGTLFTPLSKKNTSTQSLNVQLRKDLDLVVNLVRS